MSSAGLTARLVLTADASGVVGAAAQSDAALDKVAASAQRATAAGTEMAAAQAAGVAESRSLASSIAALSTETAALETAQASAAVNTDALTHLIRAAGREVGISREQFVGLHASWELLADHPIAITIAAAAAAALLGVQAFDAYNTTIAKVQNTAVALGNQFSLSAQQLEKYAADIQDVADVSIKQSAAIEQSFLSANLSPASWDAIAAASLKLAQYWGTDVPEAAKKLADALKDPKGAGEELLESLNALDPVLKQQIETFSAYGDKQDAADAIVLRINQRMKDMQPTVGLLAGAWDHFTSMIGNADIALGKWEHDALNFQVPDWMKDFWKTWVAPTPGPPAPPPQQPPFTNISNFNSAQAANDAAKNPIGQDPLAQRVKDAKAYISTLQALQVVQVLNNASEATQTATADELANAQRQLAEAQKNLTDRNLNLNESLKAQQELVKEALKDAPKMVASSALDASWQEKIAAAALDGTEAQQRLNDQYSIAQKTLPLVTAQQYAHGAAWQKLQHDIDDVTASLTRAIAAQHAASTINQVHSDIGSLGGNATVFGEVDIAGIARSYDLGIQGAIKFRDSTIAALKPLGLYTDEMARDIEIDFAEKISKSYNDAVNSVRSAIGSLTQNAGNAGFDLQLQESIRSAQAWRDQVTAQFGGAKQAMDAVLSGAGGDLTKYDALLTAVFGPDYKNHLQEANDALNKYADDVDLIFRDKIAKAYDDDLARRTDWASGVSRSLKQLTLDTDNWAKTSEQATKDFSDNFETMIVDSVKNSEDALNNFLTFFEQLLVKLAYQRFLASSVNQVGGDIMDILGKALGLGGGGGVEDVQVTGQYGGAYVGFAGGGIMTADGPVTLRKYLGGGIASTPQVAIFAEGDDPEAFVPVPNGKIPVELHMPPQQPVVIALPPGAAGIGSSSHDGAIPIKVTVHNIEGQTAKTTTKQNSDGSLSIDVMVQQLEGAMASRITRGGSAISKSLENAYQLKRKPGP